MFHSSNRNLECLAHARDEKLQRFRDHSSNSKLESLPHTRDEKLERFRDFIDETNTRNSVEDGNDSTLDELELQGVGQSECFRLRSSMQWETLGFEEREVWNEVKEILESSPSLELLSRKDLERIAMVKNQEGACLLWIAMEQQAPLEVVHVLLEADKESGCLFDAKVLSELIEKYLLRLIRGNFAGYSLEYQQEMAQEWMDNNLAKPLVCFVLDAATTSKTGIKQKKDGETVRVPAQVYSYLAKSITRSKKVQQLVNKETIKRSVVALLFLDLYSQLAAIVLFCLVSDKYLKDIRDFQGREILPSQIGSGASFVGLYVLVGYFLLQEGIKILASGFWEYAMDRWNLFDVAKLVLLLASTIMMESGQTLDDPTNDDLDLNDFSDIRALMAITGGVLFLSCILFLRNTFLPFANFVTGTVHIMYELIPFFVITIIVLVAFSYMYYVQRFDQGVECNATALLSNINASSEHEKMYDVCTCDTDDKDNFCSYEDSLYNVFGYLAGGPDDTVDFLDFICGMVVVIVFLNVVIAIVANAWDRAMTEQSHNAFWSYRLSYFGKMGLFSYQIRWVGMKIRNAVCPKCLQLCCAKYLSDAPVEKFQNKSEREDPDTAGSSSCLYKYGLLVHGMLLFFVKYVVCLLLGFVTFGFFWTEDVRKWFFYSSSDVPPSEFETLQKEMEALLQANQRMVQLQTAQSEQMVVLREENIQVMTLQKDQSTHIADMNQKLTRIMELLLLEETSSSRRNATVQDSTVPFEETSPSRRNANSQDSTMEPLEETSSLRLSAASQASTRAPLEESSNSILSATSQDATMELFEESSRPNSSQNST